MGGGLGDWGDECSVNVGDGERLLFKHYPAVFLKTLTEGSVATEAQNLFQYFTTLIEKADPLLRRRLAPQSIL